jgi:hypothetical protein
MPNSYLDDNYWAPLSNDDDDDNSTNIIDKSHDLTTLHQPKHFKKVFQTWLRQQCGIRCASMPQQGDVCGMVVDSVATSHFVRPAENLTKTGTSNKVVILPNGEKIKASHMVHLPFNTLSNATRTAHVLPNLRTNLLISVPKLADAGYTTIFHPHGEGV